MRILVLDHNLTPSDWGAADLRRSLASAGATHLITRRPPAGDLPSLDLLASSAPSPAIDAVVMSGSLQSCLEMPPWARALDQFLGRVLSLQIPVLGVCYGHQALARVLAGASAVGISSVPEYGPTVIKRTEEPSRLLEGLPKTFYSASSHREEVRANFAASLLSTPSAVRITATSNDCAVQAFEGIHLPIFGVQFHPEKDQSAFIKVRGKVTPASKRAQQHYSPEVEAKIFGNFLRAVSAFRTRSAGGA